MVGAKRLGNLGGKKTLTNMLKRNVIIIIIEK